MYQADWITHFKEKKLLPGAWSRLVVNQTVWYLGLTSFFTDISSEMVASTLPIYLVLHLGLSPLQFGVVDGLYHGMTALLRLVAGLLADRWRRYKEVAAIGYGLSAICKLGLLWAGSAWPFVAAVIAVDRTGKGIRSAPRDALLSLSTARQHLATAFGVHRALDAGGAMLGPVAAFVVLSLALDAYDAVFVVSFCVAMIGFGVLLLFVENYQAVCMPINERKVSFGGALGLLQQRRFRRIVLAGGLLSLATISDNFLYLTWQQRLQLSGHLFPLLSLVTALFYVVLSIPLGYLADCVGRSLVFVGGYGVLLLLYGASFVLQWGIVGWMSCAALLGADYAMTDGVLIALAAEELPADVRTSGLAVLATVTSLMRLLSSVLVGGLWSHGGSRVALGWLSVGLVGAIICAWGWLRYREEGV